MAAENGRSDEIEVEKEWEIKYEWISDRVNVC